MQDTAINVLRLTPAQVVVYWPLLRKLVAKAIQRVEEPTLANIYTCLMEGILDLWILADRSENPKPQGVVLAGATLDLLVGYKDYQIYGLFAFSGRSDSEWQQIIGVLEKWARGNHCTRLVAYTETPRVAEIAKLVGARAETIRLEKEL